MDRLNVNWAHQIFLYFPCLFLNPPRRPALPFRPFALDKQCQSVLWHQSFCKRLWKISEMQKIEIKRATKMAKRQDHQSCCWSYKLQKKDVCDDNQKCKTKNIKTIFFVGCHAIMCRFILSPQLAFGAVFLSVAFCRFVCARRISCFYSVLCLCAIDWLQLRIFVKS